jgi:hypothetical protein
MNSKAESRFVRAARAIVFPFAWVRFRWRLSLTDVFTFARIAIIIILAYVSLSSKWPGNVWRNLAIILVYLFAEIFLYSKRREPAKNNIVLRYFTQMDVALAKDFRLSRYRFNIMMPFLWGEWRMKYEYKMRHQPDRNIAFKRGEGARDIA